VVTLTGHPDIYEVCKNLMVKFGNNQFSHYNPSSRFHKDKPLVLNMFGKYIDLGVKTHPTETHLGRIIHPLALPIHSTDMDLHRGQVVKPRQLLQDANYTNAKRQEIKEMRDNYRHRARKRANEEVD